ncbi:hypothetical protein F8388_020481 [Cannabis sativa]|uniref:Uncharacterized protein n=1 Tax=Cannabis sativa TaxID=3483 RepID=A0A7J6EX81_CANSA|nr:hypothetical protein F8388_020481 [Cannabis sativa]
MAMADENSSSSSSIHIVYTEKPQKQRGTKGLSHWILASVLGRPTYPKIPRVLQVLPNRKMELHSGKNKP